MLYTLKINWSYFLYVTVKRQDSIVDIVTRLWFGQSRNRGLIPAGVRVAVFQSILTGSGANLASCPVGNRAFSPGIKLPECEADHLPLLPRLKIYGAILPFPNIPSWHAWGQLYWPSVVVWSERKYILS